MKHMPRLIILLFSTAAIAACGGNSSPGSALDSADLSISAPVSPGSRAMAAVVSSAAGEVGDRSTPSTISNLNVQKSLNVQSGETELVFTLTDDVAKLSEGTGMLTLNGRVSIKFPSKTANQTLDGNFIATLVDVTRSTIADGNSYNEIISGELNCTYTGTHNPPVDEGIHYASDITYTTTGSNLTITGTVNGTITQLNHVRHVNGEIVDGVLKEVVDCSGDATIRTESGMIEKCTYQADCSKCS